MTVPDAPAIAVDPASAVPPFEQVRRQIAEQATDGVLAAGTRLPPVRALAERLGLAVNTVARAYHELEAAGVVETRGRAGTVVSAGGDRNRARVQAAAEAYARTARDAGIGAPEAVSLVRAALDR